MMKLKEIRLSRGLTVKDLMGGEMHKAHFSMIETGRFLPTVPVLQYICKRLDCSPLDLYDIEEIDLAGCMDTEAPKTKRKGDRHKLPHRMAFRVPEKVITDLPGILKDLGYESRQEWMNEWLRKTMRRHQKLVDRKGEQANAQ